MAGCTDDTGTLARLSPAIRIAVAHTVSGLPNREIAARMGVTPEAVRLMLAEACMAFGVENRAELVERVIVANRRAG